MHTKVILLIMVIILLVFTAGCSITGQTSTVIDDEIVGCSLRTDIGFLTINDVAQTCHKDNSLHFVIENLGTTTVSGLRVLLESDYNITISLRENLAPGSSSQHSLNFGSQELTGIGSLKVMPLIGKSRMLCTNAVITTHLEAC